MRIFTSMKKNNYNVIGMMSGTSLDGIDLAAVTFYVEGGWEFVIRHAETFPYTAEWRKKLKEATALDATALERLNREYSILLAGVIKNFIRKYGIEGLDAVCVHGHTVFHEPEKGITLQIGTMPELAALLGQTVVCDFRTQDVALGGQGAPLVPVGDRLLFSEYEYCLNLGGFANISFEDEERERRAFDICPVNIVLNYYASKCGLDYDVDGKLAAAGRISKDLLHRLNKLDFYALSPPKSLGVEWVNSDFLPLIEKEAMEVKDVLATLTAHIAIQIAGLVKKDARVLVTGGGAYNGFLMENIRKLSGSEWVVPERNSIDFKEALIFGLLGVLRLRNEVNCLQSATGASENHSSGSVFKPLRRV